MFVRFISRSSRVRQRNRLRVTENIRKYVIRYVDVAAVLNEEHKVREVEKSRVIKINIVQVRFDFSSRKRPAVTASGTRRVFTRPSATALSPVVAAKDSRAPLSQQSRNRGPRD